MKQREFQLSVVELLDAWSLALPVLQFADFDDLDGPLISVVSGCDIVVQLGDCSNTRNITELSVHIHGVKSACVTNQEAIVARLQISQVLLDNLLDRENFTVGLLDLP